MAEAVAKGADGVLLTCAEVPEDVAAQYDAFALGCPAMGSEELEEDEFGPLFENLAPSLAGKKVALQRGSSALEAVQADEETYNAILNGGEIVEFDDNITAYLDLKSGRVDAFVVDKVVGEWIIKNN